MTTGVRDQLQSMLHTEPRDGGFTATLRVDASLSIFPDHFATGPILPGVCMIQAVLIAAASTLGVRELRLAALKTAKMTAPVRPGDVVTIDGAITPATDNKSTVRAKLHCKDQKCAEFSMTALAPSPGTPGEGWGEGSASSPNTSANTQNPHPALSRSTGRGFNSTGAGQ